LVEKLPEMGLGSLENSLSRFFIYLFIFMPGKLPDLLSLVATLFFFCSPEVAEGGGRQTVDDDDVGGVGSCRGGG
jgi:hypothetical protein